MQKLLQLVGYVTLLGTPVTLLSQTYLSNSLLLQTVGLGSGAAFIAASTIEPASITGSKRDEQRFSYTDVSTIVIASASAGITYVLSVHVGFGPVIASSLVGAAVALGIPDFDSASYCGSFVGMVSPTVLHSVESIVFAGILTGVAFVYSRNTFAGFGGKLGTLAFFGCILVALLTGVDFGAGSQLQRGSALLTTPVAVVGAIATVVLSERCELGAVLGSAVVGLVSGLFLPLVLPDIGNVLAAVAFCGSFVGMSSTEKLESDVEVGLAGGLCGLIFIAVAPVFSGAGGKLGTTAFIACVVFFGGKEVDRVARANA